MGLRGFCVRVGVRVGGRAGGGRVKWRWGAGFGEGIAAAGRRRARRQSSASVTARRPLTRWPVRLLLLQNLPVRGQRTKNNARTRKGGCCAAPHFIIAFQASPCASVCWASLLALPLRPSHRPFPCRQGEAHCRQEDWPQVSKCSVHFFHQHVIGSHRCCPGSRGRLLRSSGAGADLVRRARWPRAEQARWGGAR